MTSQWSDWLNQLAQDEQGGTALAMPSIARGLPWKGELRFTADYSADVFSGGMRAAPDGASLPGQTFAALVGSFTGGATTVILSLTAAQTAALPADADGNGLVELVFEIIRTTAGAGPYRVAAGAISVSGRAS